MPAASEMHHDQAEVLATPPTNGSGRGKWGCLAMKVLFKNLEKLSSQMENNAGRLLDLDDFLAK